MVIARIGQSLDARAVESPVVDEELASVLDQIVGLLRRQGAPVVNLLRLRIEVDVAVPAFGDPVVLVPSVVDLYDWHDGTTDIGGTAYRLFPLGWWFPPFESAVEYLGGNLDVVEDAGSVSYWRKSWFPILRSGLEALAVDCADANGHVRYSSISTTSAEPVAPSLEYFFQRVLRAYEIGAFVVVDGVVQAADEDRDEFELLGSLEL